MMEMKDGYLAILHQKIISSLYRFSKSKQYILTMKNPKQIVWDLQSNQPPQAIYLFACFFITFNTSLLKDSLLVSCVAFSST